MATSLSDVAKACSLSVNAVSEILNRGRSHLYRPETVELVRTKARDLNYRPNRSARGMRAGNSGVIAVIGQNTSPDRKVIWHHYRYSFLIGLGHHLLTKDKHLVMLDLDEMDPDDDQLGESRFLREVYFDGLVVLNNDRKMDPAQVEQLVGVPVVWYDAFEPNGPRQVVRDEPAVGRMVAGELITRGHRRLLVVIRGDAWDAFHTPGEGHFSFGQRFTAFREAAAAAGITVEVLPTTVPEEIARKMKSFRPTAIVVDGQNEFVNIFQGAGLAGFAIPRDCSLAAFDVDGRKDFLDFDYGGAIYDRYAAGEAVGAMMAGILAKTEEQPTPIRLPSVFRPGTTVIAVGG